jgi:shikimate kinase
MRLVVLTGASGAGKTTIAKAIKARHRDEVDVQLFDTIGVPSRERMVAEFGSPEAWQRAQTMEWMARLAAAPRTGRIVFEGQMRLSFLQGAIAAARIADHRIILLDCDDDTRMRRLIAERGQPELANATMLAWAEFLRNEAECAGCEILDTSRVPLEACVERICGYLWQSRAVAPM